MNISLKGKRAVIAGGSRGIGRSIALTFAAAGAHVSICARGADGLKAAAADIGKQGGQVHWGSCDLASAEAIKRYVGDAAAALGGIDILINNASGFGMGDDEAGWAAGLNVDVLATVRATHAAIPHIDKAGGGAVVNISSAIARVRAPRPMRR
jgi:3-oxoacyl-[acyl-carrier protein] reductase